MLMAGQFDTNLGAWRRVGVCHELGGIWENALHLYFSTLPCEASRGGEGVCVLVLHLTPESVGQPIAYLHVWQRTIAKSPTNKITIYQPIRKSYLISRVL